MSNHDPLQDEAARLTNIIIDQIGTLNVEIALTVVCNIAGQLVAFLSEGKPSGIRVHAKSLTENIRHAAITKILHDDAKAKKEKTCH